MKQTFSVTPLRYGEQAKIVSWDVILHKGIADQTAVQRGVLISSFVQGRNLHKKSPLMAILSRASWHPFLSDLCSSVPLPQLLQISTPVMWRTQCLSLNSQAW